MTALGGLLPAGPGGSPRSSWKRPGSSPTRRSRSLWPSREVRFLGGAARRASSERFSKSRLPRSLRAAALFEVVSDHDPCIQITVDGFFIEVFVGQDFEAGIAIIHELVVCILYGSFTFIIGHCATEIMTGKDQTESVIEWWMDVGCWS